MKATIHRIEQHRDRPVQQTGGSNGRSSSRRRPLIGGGLVALLGVAHIANDAITSMISAMLPTLQQRFDLTESTIALMVAVFAFSSSVTQPLFGALSDRLGRRPLAVIGLVLSVGLLGLMGAAPTVASIFLLLVIGGLGSSAFHPSGTSIARDAGSNKELSVGIFSAGGMLGLAIGPVAALGVASAFGFEYTPWLMVPGLLLGVAINVVAPSAPRLVKPQHQPFIDLSLLKGPVGVLAATAILMEVAFVTFTSGFPLWLVAERGVARDSSIIGWSLAAFYVAAAVGGMLAGQLGQRFSRRTMIVTALLLAPWPLFAAFVATPGTVLYYTSIAAAGVLVNASFPVMIVAAQEMAPRSEATASGILMGLSVGVAGVLYVGIGWLQSVMGYTAAMSIGYLMLIPAALLALRAFDRRSKTSRLSSSQSKASTERPTHPYRKVYTRTNGSPRWN